MRWAPRGSLGRLNGLLLLTSFGVAPASVLLAAWFGRALGPASFFLFAAVTIAAALIGGLSQRAWRDFGAAGKAAAASPAATAICGGPPEASTPVIRTTTRR